MRNRVLSTAAVLGASAALLATAPSADANPAGCGQRDVMVKHLSKAYGEKRLGAGLQSATGLMELYVSTQGSWTLLLTRPDGTSCPVAVGEQWRQDPKTASDQPV